MTLSDFEQLLAETAGRLRFERAAGAVFGTAAVTLLALGLAVLTAKLMPSPHPWLAAGAAVLLAALTVGSVFAVAWLRGPVSVLAAAAEIDRACSLKERASSLVAVRIGAAPRGAVLSAMEDDAAAALAPLDREAVLRAARPALPDRARWLVGLGAAVMATLLVPARTPRQEHSLAEMLAGGPDTVGVVQAGGAGDAGSPADRQRQKAARRALAILKGPSPSDAGGAEERKQDLLKLAENLRRSGDPADRALARRIEELAVQIARIAGAPGPTMTSGATEAGSERTAGASYARSHPEYAEVLARYFGSDGS